MAVATSLLVLAAGCDIAGDGAPLVVDSPDVVQGDVSVGLQFVSGYASALAEARREGRPLLVFFSAPWCHYCQQMSNEAFTDPEVVKLSRHFTCVVVDADVDAELCARLRVRALPTVQFISPSGVPLNRLTGKKSAPDVIAQMRAVLEATTYHAQSSDPILR